MSASVKQTIGCGRERGPAIPGGANDALGDGGDAAAARGGDQRRRISRAVVGDDDLDGVGAVREPCAGGVNGIEQPRQQPLLVEGRDDERE